MVVHQGCMDSACTKSARYVSQRPKRARRILGAHIIACREDAQAHTHHNGTAARPLFQRRTRAYACDAGISSMQLCSSGMSRGSAHAQRRMALHVARSRSAACTSTVMSQDRTWSAPAARQRTLQHISLSRMTTARDGLSAEGRVSVGQGTRRALRGLLGGLLGL